jgi:hypothetical protein
MLMFGVTGGFSMRYTLAFACLLIATSAAAAGPIPLAEFKWSQPYEVTLPAEDKAVLRMYHGGPIVRVGWIETVTAFPHHSVASQEIVDAFNHEIYTAENGELPFWNGGDGAGKTIAPCGWCQFAWSIGEGRDRFLEEKAAAGWHAEMFVPRLRSHLDGYLITSIERTVTADSQTLLFSGIPIPEPASWLLACLALCFVRRMKR